MDAIRKWGRGLLDLAKLRLGFSDIIESGWPFFGVLAKIGDQLRLDGISETFATALAAHGARPNSVAAGAFARGYSMCEQRGWRENSKYKQEIQEALAQGRTVALQRSVEAASEDACPLQRAAASAATADWLLQPAEKGSNTLGSAMTTQALRDVEVLFQTVEKEVLSWAKLAEGPYFFELMAGL
ncbi:unnamed protein product [Effrenium voratum]|nr:unnamed protein product [Effrenium voratum]